MKNDHDINIFFFFASPLLSPAPQLKFFALYPVLKTCLSSSTPSHYVGHLSRLFQKAFSISLDFSLPKLKHQNIPGPPFIYIPSSAYRFPFRHAPQTIGSRCPESDFRLIPSTGFCLPPTNLLSCLTCAIPRRVELFFQYPPKTPTALPFR